MPWGILCMDVHMYMYFDIAWGTHDCITSHMTWVSPSFPLYIPPSPPSSIAASVSSESLHKLQHGHWSCKSWQFSLLELPWVTHVPSLVFPHLQNGHIQKRDRFLILFSDLLVCASTRRKSTSFRRSSMLNLNSLFSDGLKYNIKWHVPLTNTSVAQIQSESEPL